MMDITRRAFLKAGVALSTCLLVEKSLAGGDIEQFLDDGFVALANGKFFQVRPTTCTECGAGCGIIGFVDHGRVVSIHGNPADPNSLGKICAKGLAGINRLYDVERVLYPVKRTGRRGEGRWEPISWDAALKEIARRLKEIRESGRHEDFVFEEGDEADPGIVLDFIEAFGSPLYLNRARFERAAQIEACSKTLGDESVVPDVSRSKYILNFGANPYEHHDYYVPLLHRLIGSRVENGAKMITFDVRLSSTAAKSDQWIPCRPGSDGFLAMAIANFIFRNDLHDKGFLRNWINCTEDQLRHHLSRFTLEDAEIVSGVNKKKITQLATEFSRERPSLAISGNGVRMQSNGTHQEAAILLLNALVGDLDGPGGLCLPRKYGMSRNLPTALGTSNYYLGKVFSELLRRERRISMYMAYKTNPAHSSADCKAVEGVLKDEKLVPFLVVIDSHLTETANFADIVLPAAAALESWGIESRPSLNFVPQLNLVQPLVLPPGEAKEIGAILIEVAERLGHGLRSRFRFPTAKDYVNSVLTGFPDFVDAGGLNRLRRKGLWFDPESRPDFRSFEQVKFNTPSGKYEVFCEAFHKGNEDMCSVLQPAELGTGTLVMTTFVTGLRSSMNANCKWLAEISHDNHLWIHPETALGWGIKDGNEVEVSSETGSVRVRVRITWGIRPGLVALARGFGHEAYGNIATSKPFASKDPDTKLLWWNGAASEVNANILVPVSIDPVSGGQAWKAIQVRVKKC